MSKKIRLNFNQSPMLRRNAKIFACPYKNNQQALSTDGSFMLKSLKKRIFHPNVDYFPPVENIRLHDQPKELFVNRMLALIVAIMAAYTFVGIKANLRDNYNLAPFCSLGDKIYWDDFQEKVSNGIILEVQEINCEEKCSGFFPFIFSYLFRLDQEILEMTVHALSVYFLGLTNTRIGFLVVIVNPLLIRFICILLFSDNVLLFNSMVIILYMTGSLLYLLESRDRFKLYFFWLVPYIYFILIAIFLFYVVKELFQSFPSLMRSVWPVIVAGLQNIFTKILQSPQYLKFPMKNRIAMMVNYTVFEFLEIGNLHQIVYSEGLLAHELWITLMVSLILNLDKKMLFTKKFMWKLENKMRKKFGFQAKEKQYIGEMEAIYLEFKLEIELFVNFIYGMLITLKYYTECVSASLIDCSGRPLISVSPVSWEHYVLCGFLITSSFLQIGFKLLFNLLKFDDYGYNPRMVSTMDFFYYVIALNLIAFRYCVNSLYAIMSF